MRTHSIQRIFRLLLCLVTSITPALALASGDLSETEYAIRWDSREGGPGTAIDVLQWLGTSSKSAERYTVRYYDLPRPPSAPEGAAVILRQRAKQGGKTQIRLKYRLDKPLTVDWACPSDDYEKSSEVDVAWLEHGQKVSYSYACTLSEEEAPPAALKATPKPCVAEMTRYKADGFKIEEWLLPDGQRLLEISRNAEDSVSKRQSFQVLVDQLIARGVSPADRSKTELGSDCR
jgi:hypothetical protein